MSHPAFIQEINQFFMSKTFDRSQNNILRLVCEVEVTLLFCVINQGLQIAGFYLPIRKDLFERQKFQDDA